MPTKERNPFKDTLGRYLTVALFWEQSLDRVKYTPLYTLKDRDIIRHGVSYKSLKRLYLEMADPTEYTFATTYFHDYPQWEQISTLVWFKPHIEQWRKELDLKMRAESVRKMQEIADHATQEATRASALRWLASQGWEATPRGVKNPVGRPSNQKTEAGDEPANPHLASDAERINLHIVKK